MCHTAAVYFGLEAALGNHKSMATAQDQIDVLFGFDATDNNRRQGSGGNSEVYCFIGSVSS